MNDQPSLLRRRDGHHARVTNEELVFDLVYAFAITQLAHELLEHLTVVGLIETVILWFAVWLGWQYTCWFTNWFDPEHPRVRWTLFGVMLLALILSSAIPDAFGDRGLVFAAAYVGIQVGRTVCTLLMLGREHVLTPNWQRILGWLLISAAFWIAGAFAPPHWRILLWSLAVLCEYASPMIGFALPGLGRSRTSEWTIEGGHLAERCSLFVIVALGETLLVTGATLASQKVWGVADISALLATFLGMVAMWWLYFGTASKDATARITHSDDPGRIGSYFHYVHAILVAGIIGTAVGNELVMGHPQQTPSVAQAITLSAGPALYLLGSGLYKRVVYDSIPLPHIAGAVALAALIPLALMAGMLMMGWLTTIVMVVVAQWEDMIHRPRSATAKG